MNIKVTSDSTCDLSPELIAAYDIGIVPLGVVKGGKDFKDGVDIIPDDIFKHVANGGNLCSTTAINVEEYKEVFSEYADKYDAIVHINIGSGFSSCHQNALIAAQDFSNVYVIDSKNLSTGQGLVVMEAYEHAKKAKDINELVDYLNDLTGRVEASFILNRLEYMAKGGRCSMITALGANLLKLKPCLEVIDGKLKVVKKYRGSYKRCLKEYIKDRLEERENIVRDKLFLTYTPVDDDDLDSARKTIAKCGSMARLMETQAGCTVSCHCGPGTLGVLFIRK